MKALLTCLLVFFTCCVCSAQPASDTIYNNEGPMPEHYSPVIAGAASYLFPGLGQIYCGEPDRGFRFMGAYGGGALVMVLGGAMLMHSSPEGKGSLFSGRDFWRRSCYSIGILLLGYS